MSLVYAHEPVMAAEVVELFSAVPPGAIVDVTLGGGGHAEALLSSREDLRVIGIDRDPEALDAAARRLAGFGARAMVARGAFGDLSALVHDQGIEEGLVSGVLFDLGVSSPQLERPERGFSYRNDGPLDMRMDQTSGRTAADLVNTADERHLARIFAANGEARFAKRIAGAIVSARPIWSTTELAEVVRGAIPAFARRTGGHPARRVFQAIRIAVNDELDQLEAALPQAIDLLAPGGRLVVISYHSGEDSITKAAMADAVSGGCSCPRGLPCGCGAVSLGHLPFRSARRPSEAEIARNRRSESARMRCFERGSPTGGPR